MIQGPAIYSRVASNSMILLPLSLKCWVYRCAPLHTSSLSWKMLNNFLLRNIICSTEVKLIGSVSM